MARTLKGRVVSEKADKTAVVLVEVHRSHAIYKKQYKVSKRYQAHDEKNEAHIGDLVEITEGRPISKTKRFRITSVLEKAEGTK